MLSTIFVLLAVEWMFRLASTTPTIAGILKYMLGFAIIAISAQLIALGVATAQSLSARRGATRRPGELGGWPA
jgi:hypothetical protein